MTAGLLGTLLPSASRSYSFSWLPWHVAHIVQSHVHLVAFGLFEGHPPGPGPVTDAVQALLELCRVISSHYDMHDLCVVGKFLDGLFSVAALSRSLIKIRKSTGPSTLPCGRPIYFHVALL